MRSLKRTRRRPRRPRHAALSGRAVPSRAGRSREFPDPREVSDPDGSAWLKQLSDPAPAAGAPLDWRPHVHHEYRAPDRELLARVLAGLRALPAAAELPVPADTVELPVVVCELGGLT